MSILVATIVIFTLLWGEAPSTTAIASEGISVLLVSALTMLMPLTAAAQVLIARRRHRRELPGSWYSRFQSMSRLHACLWCIASIAIVTTAGWPSVVQKLNLETPLLNELLLIFPAIFGLATSRAVFIFASPTGGLSVKREPGEIFSLWIRMRVIMVITPILFAFVVTDLVQLSINLKSNLFFLVASWTFIGSLLASCIVFYPRFLLWIWKTKPLTDCRLMESVTDHLRMAELRSRKVHVWQTHRTVANAAAIGIIPGTEVIVLSDLLLETFNAEEVDAIILHEIGHIKLRHCVKRIALVLIPLFLLALDQSLSFGFHASLDESDLLRSMIGPATAFLPAIGFVLYLYLISRTVFRSMEFEADRFAIDSSLRSGSSLSIDSALQKLAVIHPQYLNRRTGLHPSISERLAFAVQERARILESNSMSSPSTMSVSAKAIDPAIAK